MSTPHEPGGPDANDPADPMDDLDTEVLARLGVLHGELDGPPDDFVERMLFAVAVHSLEAEVAALQEGRAAVTTRSSDEPRSLTFESANLSILLGVAGSGDGTLTIDGWVAPPGAVLVELRRQAGGADRAEPDADGRFSLPRVSRGLVQLLVHRDAGRAPVITPTFEL